MSEEKTAAKKWRWRGTLLSACVIIAAGAFLLGATELGAQAALPTEPFTEEQYTKIIEGSGYIATKEDINKNVDYYRDRYITPPPENFVELPAVQQERIKEERAKAEADVAAKAAQNTRQGGGDATGCSWWASVTDPLECGAAKIANMVMWLAARLLWIAGILFNATLHYTLNFGELLKKLPIVDIGWRILRDIANIVFIFIALWSGISITLGIKAEKAWGLLAHMVLVALFINFSLYITKAIVDGSNIAALHFYRLVTAGTNDSTWNSGLSTAFMNGLSIQTIYHKSTATTEAAGAVIAAVGGADASKGLNFANIILMGVFGTFFIIVAAWVFFAATIMFIVRAITLMMLMILSPLAFVAMILPGAAGLAKEWWHKLWSQAFFAPLYMALAYVVVATINDPAYQNFMKIEASANFAAALTGNTPGPIAIIFNFILLIGLMVGCLIVAQKLGAGGSSMAMSGWEKIRAGGVGMVKGAAGAGVRTALRFGETTVGRKMLGQKWGDRMSIRYWNEKFSKSTAGNTAIGKFVRQQTTGRLAEGKVFGKSAEEAHKEAREDTSKIHIMGQIRQMRQASPRLAHLTDERIMLLIQRQERAREMHMVQQELARLNAGTPPPLPTSQNPPAGGGGGTPPIIQPSVGSGNPPPPLPGSNPPSGTPSSGRPPPRAP